MNRCLPRQRRDAVDKARRAFKRRCFWTWPWGHCLHWESGPAHTSFGTCCHCGKTSVSIP